MLALNGLEVVCIGFAALGAIAALILGATTRDWRLALLLLLTSIVIPVAGGVIALTITILKVTRHQSRTPQS